MQTLVLKKNEERRLRAGHRWVYSNEVDVKISPLAQYTAGELVRVCDSREECLGIAYIHPKSLLCARILTRNPNETIDALFFKKRLLSAVARRQIFFKEPFYRAVYGESDDLPGLIVDRYDDVWVLQFNTAGIDQLKPLVIEALIASFSPRSIILKNDGRQRALEGLEEQVECVYGDAVQDVALIENGLHYTVPLLRGQKTGWFFDHRLNRAFIAPFCKGKRVLDVFSYLGGFALSCAKAGATHVTAIDSSALACDYLKQNAKQNQLENIQVINEDAFDALKELVQKKERFDVVIVDPPAFIRSKKDKAAGMRAYLRLTQLALQVLNSNGLLLLASCSMHCSEAELIDLFRQACVTQQKLGQILQSCHQAPDHPVHPSIPETNYLTGYLALVDSQVTLDRHTGAP